MPLFSKSTNFLPSPLRFESPSDPGLPADEVHVWRVSLNLPEKQVRTLREILHEDELQRADRFQFSEHRRHFIVARGVLRMLLGRYLCKSPVQIGFEYNRYGKPFLGNRNPDLYLEGFPGCVTADDTKDDTLEFNLSHSGRTALYAFSRNRKVGIDVEWTSRRIDDIEQIVRRFFSPQEVEVFSKLPEPLKRKAFLICWTRKEAYIKAQGKGLSIELDGFDVMPRLGETTWMTLDAGQGGCWTIRTFVSDGDYIAAVAAEGKEWVMRCWQWG